MTTLVCTLELNKEKGKGLTLTIVNKEDGITQTVTMDGTTLTLTVDKGGDPRSTFTQTADTIAIKCKTFTLDAEETITCTSTKASTYTSKDALTVESTKAMTLKSSDALDVSSTKAMSLKSSDTLGVTSSKDLSLKSETAKLTGTATTSVELTGTTKVQVSAPAVKVSADGALNLESSGVATLKGNITNVQGGLVNLG